MREVDRSTVPVNERGPVIPLRPGGFIQLGTRDQDVVTSPTPVDEITAAVINSKLENLTGCRKPDGTETFPVIRYFRHLAKRGLTLYDDKHPLVLSFYKRVPMLFNSWDDFERIVVGCPIDFASELFDPNLAVTHFRRAAQGIKLEKEQSRGHKIRAAVSAKFTETSTGYRTYLVFSSDGTPSIRVTALYLFDGTKSNTNCSRATKEVDMGPGHHPVELLLATERVVGEVWGDALADQIRNANLTFSFPEDINVVQLSRGR